MINPTFIGNENGTEEENDQALRTFLIQLRTKALKNVKNTAAHFQLHESAIKRIEGSYKENKTKKPDTGYICELMILCAEKETESTEVQQYLIGQLKKIFQCCSQYAEEFNKYVDDYNKKSREALNWEQVELLANRYLIARPSKLGSSTENIENSSTTEFDSASSTEKKLLELDSTELNQEINRGINYSQKIYNGPYFENFISTTNHNYPGKTKLGKFDRSQKVLLISLSLISTIILLGIISLIFLRPKDSDGDSKNLNYVTPTITNQGELRLIKPLTLSKSVIFVEEAVTVSFTIKNLDGHSVFIRALGVGVRRIQNPAPTCTDNKWNSVAYDFPTVYDIIFQPGEEYTYKQTKDFSYPGPGTYFAEEVFSVDNKNWSGFPSIRGFNGDSRACFTVQPQN